MRRALAVSLLCFTACALPSLGLAAPGIRLSWDHCAVDGFVANKSFACDTNEGVDYLIASYDPPVWRGQVGSVSAILHLAATDEALPAWWDLQNLGSCRETSLQLALGRPPGQGACVHPYGGDAAGAVTGYIIGGAYEPNNVRVGLLVAVPMQGAFRVDPGTEHFAFGLRIGHAGTVGSLACGGCQTTACIGVTKLTLTSTDGSQDVVMLGTNASAVTWQGGHVSFGVLPEELSPDGVHVFISCDSATPVRRDTWGAVKSLFR